LKFKKDIIKKIQLKIEDAVKDAFNSKFMQEVGNETAEQIRKRTRLGKGVDEDGGGQANLGNVTEKWRDRKKQLGLTYNKLKKQLSATGEMLDSLHATEAKTGSVKITFEGRRNKNLASYHDQLGAGVKRTLSKFFNLTKGEKASLTRKLRKRLLEKMRQAKQKLKSLD